MEWMIVLPFQIDANKTAWLHDQAAKGHKPLCDVSLHRSFTEVSWEALLLLSASMGILQVWFGFPQFEWNIRPLNGPGGWVFHKTWLRLRAEN